MANAGRHNDTKLIQRMIKEERLIKVSDNDHPCAVRIKQMFNHIVSNDILINANYNGHKYVNHSAWKYLNKLSITVNQIRFRQFYFEPLSGTLYRP
jgi:hypothetical protein